MTEAPSERSLGGEASSQQKFGSRSTIEIESVSIIF
jgi:hypothetical protein